MTFIDYTARAEELQALHTCTVFIQGFPIWVGPEVSSVNIQALRQQLERDGFTVIVETIKFDNANEKYSPINILIDAPHKLGHVARQLLRSQVRQVLSFDLMTENHNLRY